MARKFHEIKALIDKADSFRKQHILPKIQRNYAWYNGSYYTEILNQTFKYNLNLTYATAQVIATSIYSKDPSFVFRISGDINSKLTEISGFPVKIQVDKLETGLEKVTKIYFNELKSRKTNRRSVIDSIIAGFGCTKMGYILDLTDSAKKKLATEDGVAQMAENLNYSEIIEKDQPFKVRVSPIDMIFPQEAPSLYELPWECQTIWLTQDKAKQRFGVSLPEVAVDWYLSGKNTRTTLCKIYEFHSLDADDPTIYTFAEGKNDFLDVQPHPLFDGSKVKSMFQKLWFNDGTENCYPIPDISLIEDQITEANIAIERRVSLMKKNRAIAAARGNWEPEQLKKYESGGDGTVINSLDDKASIEQLPLLTLGSEFYSNINAIQGEILQILGLTDYAIGGVTQQRKATEAQIMERSRLDRVQNRVNSIEDFVFEQADCLIEILRRYKASNRTFRIVYAPDDIVNLGINGKFLELLDCQIQVIPGSTVLLDADLELRRAMQLAQAAQAFPNDANTKEIWKEIVRKSGFDNDTERFVLNNIPQASPQIGSGSVIPSLPGQQAMAGIPSQTPMRQGSYPNLLGGGQ